MENMLFRRGTLQHALSHRISSFFCFIVVLLLPLVASGIVSEAFGGLGTIKFTKNAVVINSNAVVSLVDNDLNGGPDIDSVKVGIKSTTDLSGTTLSLTETGANTGSFRGTIGVSSSITVENTNINTIVGDTLTATYNDKAPAVDVVTTALVVEKLTPIVTTGTATNVKSNTATLNGTVDALDLSTTVWFEYAITSGSYTNTTSSKDASGTSVATISVDVNGLLAGTTYYYRIVAQNSEGTTYGSEMSFTTTDTATPTGSISINSNATYTNSTTVTLTLSATDDVGVTDYYISTDSTTPSTSGSGWTTITSTISYTEDVSYILSSGDGSKTIYVWYKDASANISNSANDSITLDTIQPTIIITSPTSSATYTSTSNVVNLDGVAFDSTSGISSVRWVDSNGESGTATGTTSWSISNVSLSSGDNEITVAALDGAENTSTDTITVSYSQPTPTPTPTPIPSPSPTVTLLPSPTPNEKGSISGYVIDRRGNPIESAKIRLKGTSTKVLKKSISDEDGVFEFADLDADIYTITALKKGYKTVKQSITLEEGEETDIEIVMKKSSRRIAFVEH